MICQDLRINKSTTTFLKDVSIVAQTMLLYASEKGLNGLMIGNFRKKELKELLLLPKYIDIHLVVAIGKGNENIVLTEMIDNQVNYYRDENNVHYVPKRGLDDIIL